MAVCQSCGSENAGSAKFCSQCGAALGVPAAARREERKVVTVVFADMVGSTERAERLDPEDVRALLAPYHARLRHEFERHGGAVEKFIGDAVVAVFGAPISHEDDPERAVRAALAIQEAIAEMNEADPALELEIRIGVNTGEALVALDARPDLGEGMVSGDVVTESPLCFGKMPRRKTKRSPGCPGPPFGSSFGLSSRKTVVPGLNRCRRWSWRSHDICCTNST